VAESIVRWFIVREKHCWMAADLAEPAKRTGCYSSCSCGIGTGIIFYNDGE
jgi:hypothetical protein